MIAQFLNFEPNHEKDDAVLGIASVLCWGKVVLKYKIVRKKDSSGYFAGAPSVKSGVEYVSAFTIDSNIEKEEIERVVRNGYRDSTSRGRQPENSYKKEADLPF